MINYFKKSTENEAVFKYSVKNVKEFFDKSSNYSYSDSFTYLDLEWRILYQSKLDIKDNKKYFGFFLRVDNKSLINKSNWQVKINFDLGLKCNLHNKTDKFVKYENVFNKDVCCLGINKFISVDELFDLTNGYLKDDNSIDLEVYLRGEKLN